MSWRDRARCAGMDQSIFYREQGESIAEARSVCAKCPVAVECANWAIANGEQFGVWGGLSVRQRKADRRDAGMAKVRTPSVEVKCGSMSGYRRHTRAGETPCASCKAARARYLRLQRKAKKAAERPVDGCESDVNPSGVRLDYGNGTDETGRGVA